MTTRPPPNGAWSELFDRIASHATCVLLGLTLAVAGCEGGAQPSG